MHRNVNTLIIRINACVKAPKEWRKLRKENIKNAMLSSGIDGHFTEMAGSRRGRYKHNKLSCPYDRHLQTKYSAKRLWIEGCCVVSAADHLRRLISVL
jgi:hypothetical protein